MTDSIRVAAEQARVAQLMDLADKYVVAATGDTATARHKFSLERKTLQSALEAALAALPGDKGQATMREGCNYLAFGACNKCGHVHPAVNDAEPGSQIAGRDGASAAPAQASFYAALTSPGVPSAAPLSSLSQTGDSALPQGGVGGPTYYVRHPDDSYTVADPQPVASPAAAGVPTGYEWSKDAKAFVRHNANGTDTVLSPLVSIAAELRVMLASAIEHSDGEWITGYTIKTGALHRILGLMAAAGYTVSIPTGSRAASPVALPRVTEFNVGRWCLSEDDCIAGGIDFAAYERGVADAARAFGQSPRQVAHSSQAQGELSVNPGVTGPGRMNEENQNG